MTTELRLCVGIENGKSTITDRYFTSPLKLGMPVSRGDRLQIILMMASAGILKGDEFVYEICCEEGTKTRLTEQSYTKIFDTGEGGAKRTQQIRLKGNASLYYRPSAVIPFRNSTFDGDTVVELDKESEFAWADIMTAGRVAMQERFAFRHYRNRICVKFEGRPVWMDHCLLEPERMDADSLFFYDGHTHQGTFYYYGPKEKQEKILAWRETAIEQIERMESEIRLGVTQAQEGICVRVLADTAQDIEEIFDEILNL